MSRGGKQQFEADIQEQGEEEHLPTTVPKAHSSKRATLEKLQDLVLARKSSSSREEMRYGGH
jgi:hypothetical protein